MVMLVEHGWALQVEVARAFACDVRTVRRVQQRYDEGGLPALDRVVGYPKGRRRSRARDHRVAGLKACGCSNREIGRRLGCDEKAVRKRLRRLGWKAHEAEQTVLPHMSPDVPGADPNLSGSATPSVETAGAGASAGADPNLSGLPPAPAPPELPFTMDDDPMDRRWDRLLAYLGLIEDAAPMFQSAQSVPRAGVLLALPALLETGVLDAARAVWGSIGPAFYGLRTSMVTLLLLALLRIKRPEALKEHSPPALGRVLGLDRAPEVKTLRRKLERLATEGGAERFGRLLAQHRVSTHGHALGFLYLDGHVRVYYGKHRIPKTHAARLHAVVAATTDYWVNDQRGDPLFVVTAEANKSTARMIPDLLDRIRKLVGDRRITVVLRARQIESPPRAKPDICGGGYVRRSGLTTPTPSPCAAPRSERKKVCFPPNPLSPKRQLPYPPRRFAPNACPDAPESMPRSSGIRTHARRRPVRPARWAPATVLRSRVTRRRRTAGPIRG